MRKAESGAMCDIEYTRTLLRSRDGALWLRKSLRRNSPLRSWPSRDASAAHPQDGTTALSAALMLAAVGGHLEVVRYLANEKGADVNAKDKVLAFDGRPFAPLPVNEALVKLTATIILTK